MKFGLPPFFDWNYYLDYHKDLRTNGVTTKDMAERHYLHHGRSEGRKYCNLPDDFHWISYLRHNQDLIRANIRTEHGAIEHYLVHGQHEGRVNYVKTEEDIDSASQSSIDKKKVFLVYFSYIHPDSRKNWKAIVGGQMEDLRKTQIMTMEDDVHLFVVLTGENETRVNDARNYLESFFIEYHNVSFDLKYENHYEYEGISKLYTLALQYPDKIFLYFHSKGMVFHNIRQGRFWVEEFLTTRTLRVWRDVLFIFEHVPDIHKIGCYPAKDGDGWIWYNFFWVRGSYLVQCTPPIITDNRYYYESWLGRHGNKSSSDTYSILTRSRRTFTPEETGNSFFHIVSQEKVGRYQCPPSFDWLYYKTVHKDLSRHVHREFEARRHYNHVGIYEDRRYCDLPVGFDWKTYLRCNMDLLENANIYMSDDAIHHYMTCGKKECRPYQ